MPRTPLLIAVIAVAVLLAGLATTSGFAVAEPNSHMTPERQAEVKRMLAERPY